MKMICRVVLSGEQIVTLVCPEICLFAILFASFTVLRGVGKLEISRADPCLRMIC